MKRICLALLSVFVCLPLLCACQERQADTSPPAQSVDISTPSVTPEPSDMPEPPATPPVTPEPSGTPGPSATLPDETRVPASPLDALRQSAAGRACAAAYIGYVEENTADAVRQCVEESGYAQRFPFLAEITEERIVLIGGCEVYCIVPVEPMAQVSVRPVEWDMEGAEVIGDAVYQGGGDPVLLVCNVSDIMTNSLVTIQSGGEETSFSLYISLKDGSLAATAEEQVYDFTPPL